MTNDYWLWICILLSFIGCLSWCRVASLRQTTIDLLKEHIQLLMEGKKLDKQLEGCSETMNFLKFSYCIIPTNKIVKVEFNPNNNTMDCYTIDLRLGDDSDDLQEQFFFMPEDEQTMVRAKEDALRRFYDILERLNG